MPASLLILLLVCALVLIGLPLLYRQRSERRWYLDIRARGIAVTAEVVSLTSLTRRSGSGWTVSDDWLVGLRFAVPARETPVEVTLQVRGRDIRTAHIGVGSQVAVRHLEHLPSEAVLCDMTCRPA